jgi:glycerol-3-phosphate O-acyltransferase / dihydroxyacetone phosphate acyltransferase
MPSAVDGSEHAVSSGDGLKGSGGPGAGWPSLRGLLAPPSLRGLLAVTFRRLIRLYFREIERVGEPPGKHTRGRMVVSNHNNGLIDPILVLTDTACELAPVAKSTLWDIPGLRWLLEGVGAVPIVRRKDAPDKVGAANAEVFDKIADHLSGGGNLLIFPEGTSHSEPRLAPLRSGAARMLEAAAEAAAERGGVVPTFQACALEFDDRTDFRSRCLILWGPVRRLEDITSGNHDEADRIRAITEQMAADLSDLLVEGATPQERLRVARVAELLANEEPDRTLEKWSGIGRQVEAANRALAGGAHGRLDVELVAEVAAKVDAYYAELSRLGLTDEQIAIVGGAPAGSELKALADPLWKQVALAPLAAAGVALYAIPYFVPRLLARRAETDVVSTFKLGAALVVYPVWMGGLVIGSLWLLPSPLSFLAAAVAIASPFAALRWMDVWYQRKSGASAAELADLAALRRKAREAIERAREKLAEAERAAGAPGSVTVLRPLP